MEQTSDHFRPEDEGFHFADFLAAAVESWKLVLVVPLLAGAIAFGVTYLSPPKFRSVAIVALPPEYVAAFKDPVVLDAVVQRMGLLEKSAGSANAARVSAANSYFLVPDGSSRFTASFYCNTPSCAKDLGDLVFNTLFEDNRPKGYIKEQLEQKLQIWLGTRDRLLAANKAIDSQDKAAATYAQSKAITTEFADVIGGLQNAETQIVNIRNQLRGIGEEALIQPPMLPQESVLRDRAATAFVVALVTALLVIMGVMVAESIRQYRRRPLDAHYARLMRALHLK